MRPTPRNFWGVGVAFVVVVAVARRPAKLHYRLQAAQPDEPHPWLSRVVIVFIFVFCRVHPAASSWLSRMRRGSLFFYVLRLCGGGGGL